MNKMFAGIAVVFALLAATSAFSQTQRAVAPNPPPQAPGATQTTQAPYTGTNPDRSAAESLPLFHIGQVPVVVWTPVEPPYNSKSNGTQAANPIWYADAF